MAVDEVKQSRFRRRGCVGPFSLGPLVDVVWSSSWCPRITQPSTSLAVADAFPSESKAETPRLKRCLFRIHIPAVASPVVLLLLNVTSGRTRVSSMSNTTFQKFSAPRSTPSYYSCDLARHSHSRFTRLPPPIQHPCKTSAAASSSQTRRGWDPGQALAYTTDTTRVPAHPTA